MVYQASILLVALASAIVSVRPQHTYKTVNFHLPVLKIEKSGAPLAPGYIFFAPNPQTSAALMMDDHRKLIWSSAVGNYANFATQQLNGEDMLTFWNGTDSPGFGTASHGYGTVEILNSKYESIYKICPNFNLVPNINGTSGVCQADLHDNSITPHGTVFVTAYNLTTADLTATGGSSSGYVWDSQFYEVDITTGEVLFRWSSIEAGVAISESTQPLLATGTWASPFDYFHSNSLQWLEDGFLVNGRNVWTTYKLDKKGKIV